MNDYEIYPIVQNMTYGKDVLTLSDDINVVMDENTSVNIKNYAQKILKEYQYNSILTTAKSDSNVNLLIGVIGDNSLSTLSQMLLSSRSQLKEALIEDAPETTFRGFIEGFYGNPWSHANRMDLMDFVDNIR